MTANDHKAEVIRYWLEKSSEALDAAHDDLRAGRLSFAVGRAYYACFYALSAVLLNDGKKFSKHSGVRAELHRSYVKTNKVTPELGRFYDWVFDNRQRADYQELVVFERDQVEQLIDDAAVFVAAMRALLSK